MMNWKCFFFLGLIALLVACDSPESATPKPTPQAIRVYYPASLQAWADELARCAINVPEVALYYKQTTSLAADITSSDITLEFGQLAQDKTGMHVYRIGEEQVVVVVNRSNPISQLSTDKLRQIYSGQLLNWENDAGKPIQVWVLPKGDPIRSIFDQTVLQAQMLAPEARLAPDPKAVEEAISSDETAIGYLPSSFLSNSGTVNTTVVNIIQLEAALNKDLKQPVLAITLDEPSGYKRSLLVCLQNSNLN